MNYTKLQQDILKQLDNPKKQRDIYIGHNENHYFVTLDRFTIHIIPDYRFILDMEKIKSITGRDSLSRATLSSMLSTATKEIHITDTKKIIDKLSCRIFEGDNFSLVIDEKLLKYNDLSKSTFKGIKANNPLYIYEGEELVSFILPIRQREV